MTTLKIETEPWRTDANKTGPSSSTHKIMSVWVPREHFVPKKPSEVRVGTPVETLESNADVLALISEAVLARNAAEDKLFVERAEVARLRTEVARLTRERKVALARAELVERKVEILKRDLAALEDAAGDLFT